MSSCTRLDDSAQHRYPVTPGEGVTMKYRMSCVSALALPLPTSAFVVSQQPVSTKIGHVGRHQCSAKCMPLQLQPMHMTSQAANLANGRGTNEGYLQPDSLPPMEVRSTPSTKPAFDRTNLGLHINIGSKVINPYGFLFASQAWLSALLIFPLCFLAGLVSPIFDRKRTRPPTFVAAMWGRLAMLTMGVRPKVEGAELLPPEDEAVVFVANHGSYLDIPVTNFLPRLCKYLMKAELLWLPIVGWKAVLARDIFVHRQTSATFRKLLKSTTSSLKAGNSIMTFPEGTRSRDGRLGEFKRGPFTMAQRAGVRIVPVTIMGVAKAMPFFAMAPLCKPRDVRLRIHPSISTKGRSVKEVMAEARRAVSDGLEDWQKPAECPSPLPPPSTPPSPP